MGCEPTHRTPAGSNLGIDSIQRVEISGSPEGEPGIGSPERLVDWTFPVQLLEGEHRRSFDVDRDGSRFLTLEPLEEAPPPIHVVLNWARQEG